MSGWRGGAATLVGAGPAVVVRRLPDEPEGPDVALLSPAERQGMARFAHRRDAAAFAAGRALLRSAAAAHLGCRPADVPLEAPTGGGPRIAGTELACSVAHAGDVVVVALAERGVVGVDVEPLDGGLPADEAAWIAEHLLGAPAPEVALVRSQTNAGAAFLARWTLTEAVLKALGIGLGADPREVRLELAGQPRLLAAPGVPPGDAARWRLDLVAPMPGHIVAVAASIDTGPLHVEPLA